MGVQHMSPRGVAGPTGDYSLISIAPPGQSLAWIAGQTGRDPDGSFSDSAFGQTLRALDNVASLASSIGASPLEIVAFRTLLVERQTMTEFSRARTERFETWYPHSPPPANTIAFVSGLADLRALVEIEAVIVMPGTMPRPAD